MDFLVVIFQQFPAMYDFVPCCSIILLFGLIMYRLSMVMLLSVDSSPNGSM